MGLLERFFILTPIKALMWDPFSLSFPRVSYVVAGAGVSEIGVKQIDCCD